MNSLIRVFRRAAKLITPPSLRPIAYLNSRALSRLQNAVRTGPFRGMKYVAESHCSAYLPKLLGVYERELHRCIEQACELPIHTVVDIGAAEGYYAVGMALRLPKASIIAYELDENARRRTIELAALNGVEGRVEVRGACEPASLRELSSAGLTFVICDCEGAEAELLRPEVVAWLGSAVVLVETHDFIVPGITDELCRRFAATHRIEIVEQEPRGRADYPFDNWYVRRMQECDIVGVVGEGRPAPMKWLWMMPKT